MSDSKIFAKSAWNRRAALGVLSFLLVLGTAACSSAPPATTSAATTSAQASEAAEGAESVEATREIRQEIAFRKISGGRTILGSPEEERGRDPDEGMVIIDLPHDYWVAETEVTQGRWHALMGNNPAHFHGCGETCPVETVSWYDGAAFANELSRREGLELCYDLSTCTGIPGTEGFVCKEAPLREDCAGFRLPTQAEWEHAARAGTRTATYVGDLTLPEINSSPELDAICWYAGNSGVDYPGGFDCSQWTDTAHPATHCGIHPAASLDANAWGLYDMLGNVYEWTQDELEVQHLGGGGGENPRIIRGGSWAAPGDACRASHYNLDGPRVRTSALGFRLARTAGKTSAENSEEGGDS